MLTIEELREKHGEPVWVEFGDQPEGEWAICDVFKDSFTFYSLLGESNPDTDLYNLEYDDPDGYHGLHVLGWRAFAKKPEDDSVLHERNEKAPGDAGTSDLGADEKIQVNNNTNPSETQEIKRLVKFIGLYKEMVKLTGSGYGKMAISVDLFSGDRVQVRHEWFFDNITEYNIDHDFSPSYSSYWAEISGIIVFCLVEKEGEDV